MDGKSNGCDMWTLDTGSDFVPAADTDEVIPHHITINIDSVSQFS